MTNEEHQQLIEIIHSEIEKLQTKAATLKDFTNPISPDDAIGRISRMDAINNKSVFEASLRNIENRLGQLIRTKQIANDKDYGICIKCHQTIPFQRLKLRPEIRLCAKCLSP